MKRILSVLIVTFAFCACGSDFTQNVKISTNMEEKQLPAEAASQEYSQPQEQEQELEIIESTPIEYAVFKTTLFHTIGDVQEMKVFASGFDYVQEYEFIDGDNSIRFAIGQTMDINKLKAKGWRFSTNPFRVETDDFKAPMYMSRYGRFFMILYDEDGTSSLVSTFTEMNDRAELIDIELIPALEKSEENRIDSD